MTCLVSAKATKIKQKKCRSCGDSFTPFQTTQVACSGKCALELVRVKKKKARRKETAQMRRAANLKDRSFQLKRAQYYFNAFIRERDAGLPCISCALTGNKMTAGHYRSVGSAPELRFNEDNCHGQCWWNCNRNLSGNIIAYRPALLLKIGAARLDIIEGPHPAANLTLSDIIEIKETYRAKTKALRTGCA